MSTEVTRLETAAEKREERRRVASLRTMQATMHSLIIEVENICSMGDAERAAALRRLKSRFEFLGLRADGLMVESLELAELAAIEFDDSEELAAAER